MHDSAGDADRAAAPTARRGAALAVVAGLVGVLLLVAVHWARAPRSTVGVGAPLPVVTLPLATGTTQAPVSAEGNVATLVVFLDRRCTTCPWVAAMVERLNRRYVRRDLVVMGVLVDEDQEGLTRFLQEHKVTFTVFADPGARRSAPAYGPVRVPEAYLTAPGGRVRQVWTPSREWNELDFRAAIEAALPSPAPGTQPW